MKTKCYAVTCVFEINVVDRDNIETVIKQFYLNPSYQFPNPNTKDDFHIVQIEELNEQE